MSAARIVDHDGVRYQALSYPRLSGSAIEWPAMAAMSDLLRQGWTFSSSLGWNDPAVGLFRDAELVSGIVWREHDNEPTVSVVLGWTQPQWRRRGLYRRLFELFAETVRDGLPHVQRIVSGYHVDNSPSAAMHAALGRPVCFHLTSYELDRP